MDLNQILNKTKKRSEQIENIRKPPSIASADRPYSISDISENTNKPHQSDSLQLKEISNKLVTNKKQTGITNDIKPATNWQQKEQQTGNNEATKNETGNKLVTQLATISATNQKQTGNKLVTKTTFSMLVGLQRNCLLFIYQSCKANRSKITESLSREHVAEYLKTSPGSVKITLQRLIEKGCLIRKGFKNGRGGWCIYELPENIFTEMLRLDNDSKLVTNWQQTGNKLVAEPTTQLATSLSSSSSLLNIKTTTTNDGIPEEFKGIDFQCLEAYGFTEKHLLQIIQRTNFTKEMIQDSINCYYFDLTKNNKIEKIKKPLDYFMGTVAKGLHYNRPDNYISPQQESLRQYIESQKAEKEEQARNEQEALNLSFENWVNTFKPADLEYFIDGLVEKVPDLAKNMHFRENALGKYYTDNIWPEEKVKLYKRINSKV